MQPSIEVSANAFKIVLPNMNTAENAMKENDATSAVKASAFITPQMKTVMDYLAAHGEMSDEELQTLLGIKKTRSYLLAKQMKEAGLIEIIGKGTGKNIF